MDEYISIPTMAEITVALTEDELCIQQYWSILSDKIHDAQIKVPRKMLILFLDSLLARLDAYELNQVRNECETWLDIAHEKAAKARTVVKE